MNYLYGDSTSSPLRANFLEFLRDATDFLVFALQADDSIAQGKERIRVLEGDAATELARLERFVGTVTSAIEGGEKGASDSPASDCASVLSRLVDETHRSTASDVRQRLAAAIAQIDAAEAASRAACTKALGALLAPHDPHDAATVSHLALAPGGSYDAKLTGTVAFGLAWTFELTVPEGNVWRAPVRLDSLVPHLEIRAPQLAGWISKEVKIRPQKLDRHVVTSFVDDGERVTFKLRLEPAVDVGFDVEVAIAAKRIKLARVGPPDDASVGVFDVHAEDAGAILGLAEKLRETAADLKRGRLADATLDGAEFSTLPTFRDCVERFIIMMTPIVREISERSLTPNELVIRRALGNDRREEIFVPKAILREKYAVLAPPFAEVFAPLGLDGDSRKASLPVPDVQPRTQIAASQPPPPPVAATSVAPSPEDPSAKRTSTARPAGAHAAPPPSEPVIEVTAEAPISDATLRAAAEAETPQAGADTPPIPPPPSSSELLGDSLRPSTPSMNPTRNEALRTALKKIVLLARNGKTDEAYAAYGELFGSAPFADYRPDDQRQALRLMVFPKAAPPTSAAVKSAHEVAIGRIQGLIAAVQEPADYELLGTAYLTLEDPEAANAAFRTGLERERERNATSELGERLLKRVTASYLR
jgi:hypothetical protein